MDRHRHEEPEPGRVNARDAALRRTRGLIAGVVAAAVALSGLLSVVAAQAFKGHTKGAAPAARSDDAQSGSQVPGPDSIPQAQGDPAPLQPPAQPPAASDPAPDPQVSGGS
jgi:hypothetical protein